MKTEFEGYVILDPDGEPIYDTMIEECTEQHCVDEFLARLRPVVNWYTMSLKGYSCVTFKLETKV